MRTFFIIIASVLLNIHLIAQTDTKLTEKQKSALHAAYVLNAVQNIGDTDFYIIEDYQFDENGKPIGMKLKSFIPRSNVHGTSNVVFVKLAKGRFTKDAFKIDKPRLSQLYDLKWNGNRIIEIERKYIPEYNDKGQIIKLKENTFANMGKVAGKRFYTISYGDNNEIESIEEYEVIAKLKSKKIILTNLYREKLMKRTDSGAHIESKHHATRTKKRDPQRELSHKIVDITKKGNIVEKRKISTNIRGQTTKDFAKWILNDKNAPIEIIYNYNEGKKIVHYWYEYNDKGWVSSSIKKEHDEYMKADFHSETSYTYVLKDPQNPQHINSYETKTYTKDFNEDGEVIEESADGKKRKKNPDGTWGPWKWVQY